MPRHSKLWRREDRREGGKRDAGTRGRGERMGRGKHGPGREGGRGGCPWTKVDDRIGGVESGGGKVDAAWTGRWMEDGRKVDGAGRSSFHRAQGRSFQGAGNGVANA